jgi:energy-converting hydrogenase A subunit M
MKHLKKIFESSEDDKRYIEECFLEISENPNFEVDDLLEVELTEKVDYPISVYKLHIEFGKNISLPNPVNSNLYIGMVKTDLDFLRMKNEKISELLNDIEVAINRVGEKFPNSECQIYANRREEIDIVIIVKNN